MSTRTAAASTRPPSRAWSPVARSACWTYYLSCLTLVFSEGAPPFVLTSEYRFAVVLTQTMEGPGPGRASQYPDSRLSKPNVSQLPPGRTRLVQSPLAGPAALHVFWARKRPWNNTTVEASAGIEQAWGLQSMSGAAWHVGCSDMCF